MDDGSRRLGDFIWYAVIALVGVIALVKAVQFVFTEITLTEVGHVVVLGLADVPACR